jgi:hypothetical protein
VNSIAQAFHWRKRALPRTADSLRLRSGQALLKQVYMRSWTDMKATSKQRKRSQKLAQEIVRRELVALTEAGCVQDMAGNLGPIRTHQRLFHTPSLASEVGVNSGNWHAIRLQSAKREAHNFAACLGHVRRCSISVNLHRCPNVSKSWVDLPVVGAFNARSGKRAGPCSADNSERLESVK